MLKKFVSKALLSVVMDKKARDRLDTIRNGKKPASREQQIETMRNNFRQALTPEGEKKIESLRGTIDKVMTPERQELIRNAMKIHRAKMKILDDLSDEDKKKLYVAAVRAFLHQGKGKN
ncbi:MAG: hypothetical protein QF511_12495 [Rhodospirillales bacterium]|jgi:hypothetical protein|nr:hypothetical protein [Rhodospirillales bacterium]MDP7216414.1 hypothetical protein [Rhodospirillales bacterium]HIJ42731.1 hypothetical protein [Rhodospirillaceae bacterium]HIJ93366.1 hypothetical protein [Rhodospirillaceae bacterium]HJP53833.1 hypothetical protein [Rhodospirillales bacterium]